MKMNLIAALRKSITKDIIEHINGIFSNKPGCDGRARTYDPVVNSHLLFLLSYIANMVEAPGVEPGS